MDGADGGWTPGDVAAMIDNPFYAVNIDPDPVAHELTISEKEWVAANARLIGEPGPEPYLRNLLAVLKGAYPRGLTAPPPP